MAFDWHEYLCFARSFKDQEGEDFSKEASQRCAVSRAYYAAFGCARKFAVNNGFIIKDDQNRAKVHIEIKEYFKKDTPRRGVAQHLNRLRQWRNQCDYDNEVPGLKNIVEGSLDAAEKVLNLVNVT